MSVVTFNPVLFSNAGAYFCRGAFFSTEENSTYVMDQDDDGGIEQSISVEPQGLLRILLLVKFFLMYHDCKVEDRAYVCVLYGNLRVHVRIYGF